MAVDTHPAPGVIVIVVTDSDTLVIKRVIFLTVGLFGISCPCAIVLRNSNKSASTACTLNGGLSVHQGIRREDVRLRADEAADTLDERRFSASHHEHIEGHDEHQGSQIGIAYLHAVFEEENWVREADYFLSERALPPEYTASKSSANARSSRDVIPPTSVLHNSFGRLLPTLSYPLSVCTNFRKTFLDPHGHMICSADIAYIPLG